MSSLAVVQSDLVQSNLVLSSLSLIRSHLVQSFQALLIAFTSSFLPRLYYGYTRNSSLNGFINFTLSTSDYNFSQQQQFPSCRCVRYLVASYDLQSRPEQKPSPGLVVCRYRGFRDENGDLPPHYFHLLAVRLAFVFVFEVCVTTVQLPNTVNSAASLR